jgi:molecular chaperone DnaK (HSP70)
MSWALDLGTTNTGLARWDATRGQPQLVELPGVCRNAERADPLEAPRMVPSALELIEQPGVLDRLGAWGPLERLFFLGRRAHIGRVALERNQGLVHAAFVPAFKPALLNESTRPLARTGRRPVTAREATLAYLRELLAEAKRVTGQRIRDLVVTSPVSAFEVYRAEVQRILQGLGVRRVRFVDEPVAAALGYGINLAGERDVIVVDIGGGTMHVVLVRLSPRGALGGQGQVLAKNGRSVGGNAVDGWVLEDVCRSLGCPLPEGDDEPTQLWRRLLLAEACRVKEAVFFEERAEFLWSPPGSGAALDARRPGSEAVQLSRGDLERVLADNGFYASLDAGLDAVLEQGKLGPEAVEEVLLVGGSTLLPGVFGLLERRFGRSRLRAWQPFEAVALGAACFAADRVAAADFIVHDYAFVTHDPKSGQEQHTVIVPRGTRFPTEPQFWKRSVVPTCALGEPETIFKLLICEVSAGDHQERRFVWDAAGGLHKVGGASGDGKIVVPLNAASPTLGYLDPPHSPRDKRPRLEVSFGVNAERWLVTSVRDLLTQRDLMRDEPVVRLV